MTFSPHSLQNFIVRLVQSERVRRFLLQPIQFRGWSAPAQLVIRGVDPILNNQPAEKAGPIGHQIRTKLQGEEVDATRLPLFSARSSRTTFVRRGSQGDRNFVCAPGTDAAFDLKEAVYSVPCQVCHLGSPEGLSGCAAEAGDRLQRGEKSGSVVQADPSFERVDHKHS